MKTASRTLTERWASLGFSGWPPLAVWVPAAVVAVALLLSPAYLVVRTVGAGTEVLDLLLRVRVLETLLRTAALVASVTGACVLLAVPLAWLVARTDLPLRRLWGVTMALPLVIPSYVGGFIVVVTLGPRGMVQQLLEGAFGVERLPDIQGFWGAWLTLTLLSYPYVFLTARAALARMDPVLEESSRGLGGGAWKTFFRVTLPLLQPSIMAGALLVALYTLSDFGAVSLLRYETFTWAVFLQYDSALNRTLGAALSLVLVVLALAIVSGEALTRRRGRYYRVAQASGRSLAPVPLARWRWPALAFCGGVTLFSLALPMGVLAFWAVRGLAAGQTLLPMWEAARNSIYVSALATAVTVAAAFPIAVLVVRHPGFFSAALERISYIGFALPGITIALGLVFFGANYAPALYQTTGLLVLAYAVLFLPAAVGAARTSLLQVNPNLEEAGHSLGRTSLGVLTSVTLPLVRPGILAGGALVFLLTMKELPATLVLAPTDFNTLATAVWSATSQAFFARAAAPALLLIVASSLPLAFLVLRERK